MLNVSNTPIVIASHNDSNQGMTARNFQLNQQSCHTTPFISRCITAALSHDAYLTLCRMFRATANKIKNAIPVHFCLAIKGKLKIPH